MFAGLQLDCCHSAHQTLDSCHLTHQFVVDSGCLASQPKSFCRLTCQPVDSGYLAHLSADSSCLSVYRLWLSGLPSVRFQQPSYYPSDSGRLAHLSLDCGHPASRLVNHSDQDQPEKALAASAHSLASCPAKYLLAVHDRSAQTWHSSGHMPMCSSPGPSTSRESRRRPLSCRETSSRSCRSSRASYRYTPSSVVEMTGLCKVMGWIGELCGLDPPPSEFKKIKALKDERHFAIDQQTFSSDGLASL